MRKKKKYFIYHLFCWLGLFLISSTFSSCETEKEFANKSNNGIQRRKITYEELKTNPNVINYLKKAKEKLKPQISNSERIINMGEYFIETNKVLLLEYAGLKSYTFNMYKTVSVENAKLENLVIAEKYDGSYSTKILKYNLTENEKVQLANNTLKSISNPIEMKKISNSSNNFDNSSGCVHVVVIACSSGNHDASNPEEWWHCTADVKPMVKVITEDDCGSTSGGPDTTWDNAGVPPDIGGTLGGGGTTSVSTGYPTTNTNPQEYEDGITEPVKDFVFDNVVGHQADIDDATIIDRLNRLTNRTEVKERIIEIRGQVSTVQMEQGSEFLIDTENPINPFIRIDLTPKFEGIQFGPVDSSSLIRLHSHHNPLLESVFSGKDIQGMAKYYKTIRDLGGLNSLDATSILASNLGIHALRITNPDKAYAFSQRLVSSDYAKLFLDNYRRKVQNQTKKDCNCSENNDIYQQLLLQNLIKFLTNQDTGLSCFRGTISANGSIIWSR